MGCDYYTVDGSGEFKIEVRVECGDGNVKTEQLSIDVPEDSEIYVDENIGDWTEILTR
jgi:DNA-directed RNA polymerase alpha subunit